MTLIGFRAQNHPAQTSAREARDDVDDRRTDPAFFEELSRRFGGFTLDAAASAENTKCAEFYSKEDDSLRYNWYGRVWCNPPYSDCRRWVEKAWNQWLNGNVDLIVMLLPANRTEQAWWQDFVEPHRDQPGGPLRVEFLRGRMRFGRPESIPAPKGGDRPPFGCCLLIWQGATL